MIISYSGRKRSGKDTAGSITQVLLSFPKADNETVIKYLNAPMDNPTWKIKKWAGYLKQIVAILTNHSVEDLENEDVKNEVMYIKYVLENKYIDSIIEYESPQDGLANYELTKNAFLQAYSSDDVAENIKYYEKEITIRNYLERIGTDVGRVVHSKLWIDRLMMDYHSDLFNPNICQWIITDTRFPNEATAVENNHGINIRINRNLYFYGGSYISFTMLKKEYKEDTDEEITLEYANKHYKDKNPHISETALDNYTNFKYVIENDGTIEDLIDKIRELLIKEYLI